MFTRQRYDYFKHKLQYQVLGGLKAASQMLHRKRSATNPATAVLIGGVPRSGTTMLMDVLARSFDTEIYREHDPRAFADSQILPVDTIRGLINASRAQCVCFKALSDSHSFASLIETLSPATAFWIVRDVDDVVNSHTVKWTGMPRSIASIVEDRNSAGWRGRGMSDATHELVKTLYRPTMSNASACALFWYFRNVLFFEQSFDLNPRVMLVRYEQLVSEPHQQFRKIFEALELRYSSWVAKQVFASSIRKRPPQEIDPAIRELCESLTARFDALAT